MVYRESYKVQSRDRAVSFHDVTDRVREIAKKSGIQNGIVVVYTHHTTCSVITQESGIDMSMTGLDVLQQDLVNVFEKVIPTCRTDHMYLHPGPKMVEFAAEHGPRRIRARKRWKGIRRFGSLLLAIFETAA